MQGSAGFAVQGGTARLADRRAECAALHQLVEAVTVGQSRALVVHGEPGAGKTVLLEYLAEQAAGCQVVRVAGVQSEMELAFAGLHQVCAPLLDRLEVLPGPQAQAVRTAFGLSAGPVPDRFLVGLGVLSLLAEVAAKQPLVCLVDDAQWLDRASAQVLAFVARRLDAESVGLVFGTRIPGGDLVGLPELVVGGLPEGEARALLDAVLAGPIDERVREQIVAEAGGNPLALLELPRGLTAAELAGGFGLPGAVPLAGSIEDSFRRRVEALPAQTRLLLLVAAADPTGDPVLVWRAAGRLGIGAAVAQPAVEAGLVEFGGRVRFRHPLVRSAVYRSAPVPDKQQAHAALAEVTDPQADPDRRAWHRAAAAAGPDEQVAAELERSAGRAQARGGLAAAAAFWERAAALTADPARRAGRTLAAAQASLRAGAFGKTLDLLAMAEAGPLDELQGARADLLRGQAAFASGLYSDAPALLLKAARRLEPLDLDLARETYLDAYQAARFAGHLAGAGNVLEVSRAAQGLPPPTHPPRPGDLLLDGLGLLVTDGPGAAAPALRRATRAFASADVPAAEALWWGWLASAAGYALWDHDWDLTARQVQLAREVGALGQLPILLSPMAMDAVWSGDLGASASLIAEADTVRAATGSRQVPFAAAMLAAFRGREAEAAPLIQATLEQAAAGGQGGTVPGAYWVAAVLCNGLDRYEEALAAARQAREHEHAFTSAWALPELIEAAVRTGSMRAASDALDLLAEGARAGGTDWGLGIEARCRALLSEGEEAERLYTEAIGRLGRTRLRPDLARAHLLYGEWLSQQQRRGEARGPLRTAHDMLEAIGMEAFAARARRELQATGETARKRTVATGIGLTAQEAQIAQLARDGLSNPEIGARLFLSPRTVQYHLGKVFTKLDITSRSQLHRVLSATSGAATLR
ncbi:MAG TPA: AAA family ATPase [Streptosporangiaceae bacterium]|nr:AAA family ATPase [Streptosporangiaceae bacterium]